MAQTRLRGKGKSSRENYTNNAQKGKKFLLVTLVRLGSDFRQKSWLRHCPLHRISIIHRESC